MTNEQDQFTEDLRDQLAEQAWGVLIAAGFRDGTRRPSLSVLAHAIVGNQLPIIEKMLAERDQLRESKGSPDGV